MKKKSTLFLKTSVYFMGLLVFPVGWVWLPRAMDGIAVSSPNLAFLKWPMLIGVNLTALPFFFALYQALKLIGYIDKNCAFSDCSVSALRKIRNCALLISASYLAVTGFYVLNAGRAYLLYGAAGFIIVFAAGVIAVFAAVLEKLLQDALEIKNENDLTI